MQAEHVERRHDHCPCTLRGDGIEISLVDDDDVGEFGDALLDRLEVVARVRQLQQREHVGHARHGRLALADADRLDDDGVVAGGLEDEHGLARLLGHPAQRARRRAGPDEARSSAESRAMRVLSPRIDPPDTELDGVHGEHGHAVPLVDEPQAERLDERALARRRARPRCRGGTTGRSAAAASSAPRPRAGGDRDGSTRAA